MPSRRSNLGPLKAAALFLILGGATTVGVAWVLALTLDVNGSFAGLTGPVKGSMAARARRPDAGEGTGWITIEGFARSGASFYESYVQPADGEGSSPPSEVALKAPPEKSVPQWAWRWIMPWRVSGWPPADETSSAQLDVRGWPFLALFNTYSMETDANFKVVAKAHGAIEIPTAMRTKGRWSGQYPAALPLRPVWPGFALNTLIYGAGWWVLASIPVSLRKRHREKHGRCAWCGYDRAGLEAETACPECGRTKLKHIIGK